MSGKATEAGRERPKEGFIEDPRPAPKSPNRGQSGSRPSGALRRNRLPDSPPDGACRGRALNGQNRWGPGIPGDTILFGQSAVNPSGNPYHGEFSTEKANQCRQGCQPLRRIEGNLGSLRPLTTEWRRLR
jgi:hypothetical protein